MRMSSYATELKPLSRVAATGVVQRGRSHRRRNGGSDIHHSGVNPDPFQL
jgi:hypothetical protein